MAYPTHQMTWEAFRQTAAELTTRLKKLDQNNWGAYFLKKEMHLFYFLQSQPFRWDSDDFSLIRPGLSPVSYTHLDVYKRQDNTRRTNFLYANLTISNFA